MTFITWLHHLPLFAKAAALAAIIGGLVRFGADLLKSLESWRNLHKPKDQPTLNDIRKVERTIPDRMPSNTARDMALGAMLGGGVLAGGALLEHHYHIETISSSAAAATDLNPEHLAPIADAHHAAEHAHGLIDVVSNILSFFS